MLPFSPAALIFDLDGTLVDSEPLHCRAWLQILDERAGLEFDEHWFEQWIGTSDRFLAESVIENHDLSFTITQLQQWKQERYYDILTRDGQAFPQVDDYLTRFGRRFPLAIVTNSSRRDAEHVFRRVSLDRLVDTVVTFNDVANPKPAPDPYLLAANRLAVPPDHCVVVEDSPAGAQSARAAGMYVLGLTSSQPADRMGDAHQLFADTGAALAYLAGEIGE